jgi:pyrimidine-nucleoside phosphorylase
MSKKIAAGADAIVLDVKVGEGAFMTSLEQAKQLAAAMVEIGKLAGRETVALISDMNRPLGQAIGNALEVREALRVLKNESHGALREVSLAVASKMTMLGGRFQSQHEALRALTLLLENGAAFERLRLLVAAQGGDVTPFDEPSKLPKAPFEIPVHAKESGVVQHISAIKLGQVAMSLGAGRIDKTSQIDLAVGIELKKQVGDHVEEGSLLCVLHSNQAKNNTTLEHIQQVMAAFQIRNLPVEPAPLIHGWYTAEGFHANHS